MEIPNELENQKTPGQSASKRIFKTSKSPPKFKMQEETSLANGVNGAQQSTSDHGGGGKKRLLYLLSIFLVALLMLIYAYSSFPQVPQHEKQYLKLPRSLEEARDLGMVLNRYSDEHFASVYVGFCMTYIFLQSFAIPGSISLSVLSGYLFSLPLALFSVCMCSAIGASVCYLLSFVLGRRLVIKYFAEKVANWSQQVRSQRDNLFSYIFFLRVTPFLPNWFINIASPVIDVPLDVFFIGTFVGVAPPSFVAVQAGSTLQELSSSQANLTSWKSFFALALLAGASLVPVVIKRYATRRVQ